jgi:galactokinase/mevalonate kinase-like predicted kinase
VDKNSSSFHQTCRIPYRLDLAGGWLDQPFVSKYFPGPVITISIEPDIEFNERSGMAGSTRFRAIDLWQTEIPEGDPEKLAKTLFNIDNPPGSEYFSGSQDAIGIVFPGVNRLDYSKGAYWPEKITSEPKEDILLFIEEHLWLIDLSPRTKDYDVLTDTVVNTIGAKALARAADGVWNAILSKDLNGFGKYFRESFEAQVAMFPHMVNPKIMETIDSYARHSLGWKISGAGGGGYLVLVSDHPIENAIRIRIKRGGRY